MDLCKSPNYASEVTLQPIERFGFDAAILFSDILTIPDALGFDINFSEGKGPVFSKKIENEKMIADLGIIDPRIELAYVEKAVNTIKKDLNGKVPLIGFSGSPWTLACYMITGSSSKDEFMKARSWMYKNPTALSLLLEKLELMVFEYCLMQYEAGADILMIFDSWGGLLNAQQYELFSLQYIKRIVNKTHEKFAKLPVIVFSKGCSHYSRSIAKTGCNVIGLEWTADIAKVIGEVGHSCSFQGNLDPSVLLGTPEHIEKETKKIIDNFFSLGFKTGHIFNLGHGISQFTPPENVTCLVNAVKKFSSIKK